LLALEVMAVMVVAMDMVVVVLVEFFIELMLFCQQEHTM
jgi:hypothetical protein